MSSFASFTWPELDYGDTNPVTQSFPPQVIGVAGTFGFNITVPGANAWRVASARLSYLASAAVGNRGFNLFYQENPGLDYFQSTQSLVGTAGNGYSLNWNVAVSTFSSTLQNSYAPLLDIIVISNHVVSFIVTGAQIGDIFGPLDMYRIEISTTPEHSQPGAALEATPVLL